MRVTTTVEREYREAALKELRAGLGPCRVALPTHQPSGQVGLVDGGAFVDITVFVPRRLAEAAHRAALADVKG